jgi:hypothetical protein
VYEPPGAIIGELKAAAPAGTLVEYTVWLTVSPLVQVTVPFTPMTTVIVSGEKPGAALAPTPAPLGIMTDASLAAELLVEYGFVVEIIVEVGPDEVEVRVTGYPAEEELEEVEELEPGAMSTKYAAIPAIATITTAITAATTGATARLLFDMRVHRHRII